MQWLAGWRVCVCTRRAFRRFTVTNGLSEHERAKAGEGACRWVPNNGFATYGTGEQQLSPAETSVGGSASN